MLRHYYISDDLGDLEVIEQQLKEQGLASPQLHVLSENDAELEKHHLNAIEAVLKQDVVHSTELGALLGIIAAAAVVLVAYIMEWHMSAAGWLPFGFLAIVLLGFFTWEGGLIGIQLPNHQFKHFQKLLDDGKHVFFVDIDTKQQDLLNAVVAQHPRLQHAGSGEASPAWLVKGHDKYNKFMKAMP